MCKMCHNSLLIFRKKQKDVITLKKKKSRYDVKSVVGVHVISPNKVILAKRADETGKLLTVLIFCVQICKRTHEIRS